ncbi:COG2355 Zn-dependent dipeptidase, microsomal dipeptidase homolog [Sphingomonadaceae bacterium]|jgi:membrane dipeptidase|nr:dipeptidase [Sphingomonadaceae bacterium]
MRKRFWIPVALIAAAALGFFGFLPGYVEGSMNQVDGKALIAVSDEAKALHKTLNIVDLHSDTLMWDRDINDRVSRGHVDLPRLQNGNVALQLFSSVTKTPKNQNYDGNGADSDNITLLTFAQLQPVKTWHSLVERSLYHAAKRGDAVAGSNGALAAVDSAAQLDTLLAARQTALRPVGAMLTIEGLQNLEGKASNLDRLYDAGFRMAGLTHFFDNELGGSMHGLKKGGLTPFGRDIVRRMEAKGMIVDIAHLSHKGVAEVLAMATRPVVSSHGGVQATCKVNRNLTDDEVRGVAKTGGVIGIGYWDGAICSTDPRAAAKAMKHVRDLVGIQHVALGSDYDGATTVRFDTSQLVQVTQALLDEGFTAQEIRAVMGENALRVIRAGLVPMIKASAV